MTMIAQWHFSPHQIGGQRFMPMSEPITMIPEKGMITDVCYDGGGIGANVMHLEIHRRDDNSLEFRVSAGASFAYRFKPRVGDARIIGDHNLWLAWTGLNSEEDGIVAAAHRGEV